MGINRKSLVHSFENIIDNISKEMSRNIDGQLNLFGDENVFEEKKFL